MLSQPGTTRVSASERRRNWKFALRLITELIIDDPNERDSGEYSNPISVISPFWRVHLNHKYIGWDYRGTNLDYKPYVFSTAAAKLLRANI